MKQEQDRDAKKGITDMSLLSDRSKWHFSLYNNKDDPRPIVPKNHGYGSTINFANRRQVVQFFFVLLAAILPILLVVAIIVLLHH